MGHLAIAAAVPEVDPARQLADHEQVGALDALSAQRTGPDERRARAHRTEVGDRGPAPFGGRAGPARGAGADGIRGVPLRPPDRAEEDGVRVTARLEHLVGERLAVGIDRGSADQVLREFELAEALEQPPRGGDDLGADAVPGQQDYPCRGHGRLAEMFSRT